MVIDPLISEYGAEAVMAVLAKAKDDPYIAAAMFEISGARLP